MSFNEGTPETRLWAAVGLSLVKDCRDDILNQISEEGIGVASRRWKSRASEPSFIYILGFLDLDYRDLLKWIDDFGQKARVSLNFRQSRRNFEFLEDYQLTFAPGHYRGY